MNVRTLKNNFGYLNDITKNLAEEIDELILNSLLEVVDNDEKLPYIPMIRETKVFYKKQ